MELALLIYLAGVAAQVKVVAQLSLTVVVFVYAMYLFSMLVQEQGINYKKTFAGVVIALASLIALTPDKETIYMMAAGYTGQKVVENISSSEAVGKVQVILNNKLDEIIVEQQKKLSK
jgi:hypothetical protein